MKISELTADIIAEYVNIDAEDTLIPALLSAAISYAKGYTGLTAEQLDEHEDITIAVLALISDMYDVRSVQVDTERRNETVISILSMYATNYLPDPDAEVVL